MNTSNQHVIAAIHATVNLDGAFVEYESAKLVDALAAAGVAFAPVAGCPGWQSGRLPSNILIAHALAQSHVSFTRMEGDRECGSMSIPAVLRELAK